MPHKWWHNEKRQLKYVATHSINLFDGLTSFEKKGHHDESKQLEQQIRYEIECFQFNNKKKDQH